MAARAMMGAALAEFIKTKINMDKLGNALGGLKGLFGK